MTKFANKDPLTRLNDIVNHICSKITDTTDKTNVRKYLNEQTNYTLLSSQVLSEYSDKFSFASFPSPPAHQKAERADKRALLLLAIMKQRGSSAFCMSKLEDVKSLSSTDAADKLNKLIYHITIAASQRYGDNRHLDAALAQLKNDPSKFLNNNKIHIYGAATMPTGHTNIITVRFGFEYTTETFKFQDATSSGAGRPISVVMLPGVVWDEVPGRTNVKTAGSFANIAPIELTGSEIMLTTQFSGCAFCHKQMHGGTIYAAHIMPSGANAMDPIAQEAYGKVREVGDGETLAKQLLGRVTGVAAANFSAPGDGAGDFYVYGAQLSGSTSSSASGPGYKYAATTGMFVIGVCPPGQAWKVFSQVYQAGVFNVDQIF
ncbi:hypothetical protein [Methylocystis heyeri]|uniref:Uncharacterized protein n=1 Tax=Methylocystis heyeri TaxID=391905 RepID=A0A6B8KB34_9HYPH|nr:hypothetical protein [Methylocystis heyeri]QGM45029.1 hypothetical protein H2LOC_004630 [Methylocystis heyeri]